MFSLKHKNEPYLISAP